VEPILESFAFQGFVQSFTDFLIAAGVVKAGDVKIVIIRTTRGTERY
jgi:hypothetical protein